MEINKKQGTILIVDDSTNNIELLSDILIDKYEVFFATSGKKALSMLNDLLPDLILLDIVMPEMDGYELISQLKSNHRIQHIPIIFITAKATTDDMIKGFKMGAVDYISKPFAVEEVKVRVKTQVENQLLLKALKNANQQLEKINRRDGLTGIANRRYFDEFLQLAVNRTKRHLNPLSLLLIDIDYFKLYNDHYGHQKGDACLIKVAQQLNKYAQRDGEMASRYGGEEFAIILSEMSAEEAKEHAQKCLQSIETLQIEHKISSCNPFVTISMGLVTQIVNIDVTPGSFIKKADYALYEAKKAGRNRLCIYNK